MKKVTVNENLTNEVSLMQYKSCVGIEEPRSSLEERCCPSFIVLLVILLDMYLGDY